MSLTRFELKFQEWTQTKQHFDAEIKLPLLSEDEQKSADAINKEIAATKRRQDQIVNKMHGIESKQKLLSEFLGTDLLRRQRELDEQSANFFSNSNECKRNENQLEQVKMALVNAETEINNLQSHVSKIRDDNELKRNKIKEINDKKLAAQTKQQHESSKLACFEIQKKNLSNELNALMSQAAKEKQSVSKQSDIIGYS